ncbi:MAG: hypothetical protein MUP19_06980, partial [Candidatus Aminicenantes bacterium]|nr:hypothetical protein [Candidatus Aminicenantes bacterium]
MKQRGLIIIIFLSALSFQAGFVISDTSPQGQSPEDEVRATLGQFQKGVEAGDKGLGPLLSTKGFAASFVPFYDMLAQIYSRNQMAFPMKIGHVKILRDGRAKV